MSNSARADIRKEPGGVVTVEIRGKLDARSAGACWRQVEQGLRDGRASSLTVDASGLKVSGGIGMAFLRYLSEGRMTPGAPVTVRGLSPQLKHLLDTFRQEAGRQPPPAPAKVGALEEVGGAARALIADLRAQMEFLGAITSALPGAIAHPRRMRWGEVEEVMEKAGVNAVPVVTLFSLLVGLVMALEAAHPLGKLGAQIFIADMIGFSAIRDTGPLVTAIMLAGRSGSAFAAELGTMKVNEELDALTTMGLDPVQFLTLQRVVAAFLLTPLLTLYAMLMSIVGGILVMRVLGFAPRLIFHEIVARVRLNDLFVGLLKAAVFGLIVAGVGCLRGLQTREGPRGVGISTTRSVVAGIVLVILANTVFSWVQYFFS